MGRVSGKVALITGAARGQGRSHAVRLAEEGADIIAVDSCSDVASVKYPMASADDLAETERLVEKHGRRILTRQADVRDQAALDAIVVEGLEQFGHIDIACANAGIASFGRVWELSESEWQDMIDINLSGVWHTAKAVVPTMIESGRGGSIIFTSSIGGLKGLQNVGHYAATKHGMVGLMRTLANEVAQYNIRVNTVHPTNVATDMIFNEQTYGFFRPDLEQPTREDAAEAALGLNALSIPWVDPVDISNAVLWLASDEARYVTGVTLPVDGGAVIK